MELLTVGMECCAGWASFWADTGRVSYRKHSRLYPRFPIGRMCYFSQSQRDGLRTPCTKPLVFSPRIWMHVWPSAFTVWCSYHESGTISGSINDSTLLFTRLWRRLSISPQLFIKGCCYPYARYRTPAFALVCYLSQYTSAVFIELLNPVSKILLIDIVGVVPLLDTNLQLTRGCYYWECAPKGFYTCFAFQVITGLFTFQAICQYMTNFMQYKCHLM